MNFDDVRGGRRKRRPRSEGEVFAADAGKDRTPTAMR
jgi:hypothetical protein